MAAFLSIVVALATFAYILAPVFSRGSRRETPASGVESWHSVPQLEIDRALGKIDDAEFEEMRKRTRSEHVVWPIEILIHSFRRARRLDRSVETEVLIARARHQPRPKSSEE